MCSTNVKTLILKTMLTKQLHKLALPTLIAIPELQITAGKLFT